MSMLNILTLWSDSCPVAVQSKSLTALLKSSSEASGYKFLSSSRGNFSSLPILSCMTIVFRLTSFFTMISALGASAFFGADPAAPMTPTSTAAALQPPHARLNGSNAERCWGCCGGARTPHLAPTADETSGRASTSRRGTCAVESFSLTAALKIIVFKPAGNLKMLKELHKF